MKLRGKNPVAAKRISYLDSDFYGNRYRRPINGIKDNKTSEGKNDQVTQIGWGNISRRELMVLGGISAGGAIIAGLSPAAELLNRLGSPLASDVAYADSSAPIEDGYYTIHPFGNESYCLTVYGSSTGSIITNASLVIQKYQGLPNQEFRFDRTTVNTDYSNVYTIEPTAGWMRCLAVGTNNKSYDVGTILKTQTRVLNATHQRFYIGYKKSTNGQYGYIIVPEGNPGNTLAWSNSSSGTPSIAERDDAKSSDGFSSNQLWTFVQRYSIEYTAPSTTWKSAESMPFLGAEYAACRLTNDTPTVTPFGKCETRNYIDYKENNTSRSGYFFTGRDSGLLIKNVGYDADGNSMDIKLTMLAMKGWSGSNNYETNPEGSSYPAVAFLKDNFLTRWEPDDNNNTYIGFQLETWCAEARVKMEWLKTGTSKAANCKIAGTFADVDIARNNSDAPRWFGCEGICIPLQTSTIYRWKECVLNIDTNRGGVYTKTGNNSTYNTLGYNKKTMVHFTTNESYLIIEYAGQGCGTRFDFYYPNIIPGTPEKSATITSG